MILEIYQLLELLMRSVINLIRSEVLAHEDVLNVPDRREWNNCQDAKEDEIKNVERFRNKYRPFDVNA